MYFEELLSKVTEPADLAVFFLGFSFGFIVDSFSSNNNVPAGTVAGVIAIGSLGIKKGLDAYLTNSGFVAKRRRKKKLNTLRRYFSDSPYAIQLINDMENVFKEQSLDDNFCNQVLDIKLQNYIITLSKELDQHQKERPNVYEDLRELYNLAKSPEENVQKLKDLCQRLKNSYLPRKLDFPTEFEFEDEIRGERREL